MSLAQKDGEWLAIDDLATSAVSMNYLHGLYLLLVAEYAQGNYARVIEIAEEYNTTAVPDDLSDGYHRESHLWADVFRWRAEKALGINAEASSTSARVRREWPNSEWAKRLKK